MNITIDQAMAFIAIHETGTIQKAAQRLGKGHSAILYLVKNLEQETELSLFDRSGYRNRLTSEGELVLHYCKKLITTKEELTEVCHRLKGGWEPRLSLIYDGVIDFEWIADVLLRLNKDDIPTEIKVSAAHLDEVEKKFNDENADMMLTILPNPQLKKQSLKLKPISICLVAHKNHPLFQKEKMISMESLKEHTYIRVRGSSTGIGLSTEQMEIKSRFIVNGFYTKKQAIMKSLGYGWLPEYMIQKELKENTLRILPTEIPNTHKLYPRLYHKKKESLGKAAEAMINSFSEFI